jgi:hypothetical protein
MGSSEAARAKAKQRGQLIVPRRSKPTAPGADPTVRGRVTHQWNGPSGGRFLRDVRQHRVVSVGAMPGRRPRLR